MIIKIIEKYKKEGNIKRETRKFDSLKNEERTQSSSRRKIQTETNKIKKECPPQIFLQCVR